MLEDFMVETGNRAVTDHEEFNCARVLKVMIKDKPAAACAGNNRRNQNDLHADLVSLLVMCPNFAPGCKPPASVAPAVFDTAQHSVWRSVPWKTLWRPPVLLRGCSLTTGADHSAIS